MRSRRFVIPSKERNLRERTSLFRYEAALLQLDFCCVAPKEPLRCTFVRSGILFCSNDWSGVLKQTSLRYIGQFPLANVITRYV